jgi:Rieske 2Fe-2S family protein
MEFSRHVLSEKATTLPREYYVASEIYAKEQERIFRNRWIAAGRADRLARPGDYALVEIAGESLILVRDADGKMRAFYNVCRHRGTRLCEAESGRLGKAIVCPYHSWSYGFDGALIAAPNMEDVPWFDRADQSLFAAAADVWEGFLFLHLGRRPQALGEVLRPIGDRFAPGNLPRLATVRRIAYDVAANWKLLFQNFSECLHCPPVHPALARLSHYQSGANDLREGPVLGGYMTIDAPGGSLTMSGQMCGAPLRELSADDARRVYYYSVFPGFFLTIQPDFVMSTRISPLAVDRTRVECEWHFAPETLDDPKFDPTDGIALWDTTNRQDWHVCELAQKGVSSRAYVPGLYSTQESLLAAFDREYLASLEG